MLFITPLIGTKTLVIFFLIENIYLVNVPYLYLTDNIYSNYGPYFFDDFPSVQPRASTSSNQVLKRYNNVKKSENDHRRYRGLELSNKMRVLLISEPKTIKSAAALKLHVGSMNDPKDISGLAHFCEHMLFRGTKKFPRENEYFEYVQTHGGISNAGTGVDETFYHFDISAPNLKAGLERFSEFFNNPLFSPNSTEREINAVHSEFQNNLALDSRRLDQMNRHLSEPTNPYHRFSTGNMHTLKEIPKKKNIDIRKRLIEFFNKWYSSNLMDLVVLGQESLDQLEKIVVPLFSKIKNKKVKQPMWNKHPYGNKQFRTKIFQVPLQDLKNLIIAFPQDDLTKYYKTSPQEYTTKMINQRGPGSFFQVLKNRGYITNVLAQTFFSPRGTGFFSINIDLTDEGLEKTDEITKFLFQYLNMIKKKGPQRWFFEENMNIGEMEFRFKDEDMVGEYVTQLARNLRPYDLEDVLQAKYIHNHWCPELIKKIWKTMIPEKIRIYVLAKKFKDTVNETEPIYGTRYNVTYIPESTIKEWKNAGLNNIFKMPVKNEFIITNVTIRPADKKASEFPVIIKETPITRTWFKQDDKFLLPKASVKCILNSPWIYHDPLNFNLAYLFTLLLLDSLEDTTYAAQIAGLQWNLIMNLDGRIIMSMDGFSQKQRNLLEKIFERMTNFKVDSKRFKIIRERLLQELHNNAAVEPYMLILKDEYFRQLLSQEFWTKQELLASTKQLTQEILELFIAQILRKLHIECLIYGNFNKQEAIAMVELIETSLTKTRNVTPLLPSQLLLTREVKLQDHSAYSYEVFNSHVSSSSIGYYLQCGLQTKQNNVKVQLISQIIKEPTFDILRTKEQLGYVVLSLKRSTNGIVGLVVIIQSQRHPNFLESRIEAFFDTMLQRIKSMTEDDFAKYRAVVTAQIHGETQQMKALTDIFWLEISTHQYKFNRAKEEIAYLNKLTKNDVLRYFQERLSTKGRRRKKLVVKIISNNTENTRSLVKTKVIKDIVLFRNNHELYSLIQPMLKKM